jgi:hypothetical protein
VRGLGRWGAGKVAVATSVAALLLSPALAAPDFKRRAPAISLSADPGMSFTPAGADPRLAAALSRRAPVGDFKFTPAAVKTRPSQLRVAIRARTSGPTAVAAANGSASPVSALAPVTYNLGAAVGWRRFAVAGEVGKVKPAGSPVDGRESAAVGISYSLPRFTGRLAVSADRSERRAAPALREPDNVAVDLGGSYSLSRRIAVTGGVRYKVESDRLRALKDERVDSQAVYVGTAVKF